MGDKEPMGAIWLDFLFFGRYDLSTLISSNNNISTDRRHEMQ